MVFGEAVTPAHFSIAATSIVQTAKALNELKSELLVTGRLEEKTEARKNEALRRSKNGIKGAAKRREKYDDLKKWIIGKYLEEETAFANKSGNHVARLLKKEVLDHEEHRYILMPENIENTIAKWVNECRAGKKMSD
jgi:hypothetical protein